MRSLILFMIFGIITIVSAQTFYVQNDAIRIDANTKANLISKTNAQIDFEYSEKIIQIKPLFETNLGVTSFSVFSSTNIGTSYSTSIDRNGKLKWKQNFNIPSIAATNLKAIYYEIVYPKGINASNDVTIEGNKIYLPEGVTISFQDLADTGYIIKLLNSTMIKIEGVSKTAIELDPEIIIYQNIAKKVYDTEMWQWSSFVNLNYGASTLLNIQSSPTAVEQLIMAFDTSEIPQDAIVTSAKATIFETTHSGTKVYSIERIMANWSEGDRTGTAPTTQVCGATWNYTCFNNTKNDKWFNQLYHDRTCTTEGQCDIFTNNLTSVTDGVGGLKQLYIQSAAFTDLVQQWVNGTATWRMGILINDTSMAGATNIIVSSENSNIFRRPILEVDYTANLTINATNSTSTTPNTPIYVLANFKNSGLPNNGSEIYGGKYLLIQNQKSRRTTFSFGAFVEANKTHDFFTGGRDSGVNETIFTAQNGTQLDDDTDLLGDATDSGAIDVNGDGIDEIMRGQYSGSATYGGSGDLIYKNGTTGWSTVVANGQTDCNTILIDDFDADGIKDIGVGCSGNFSVYNASPYRQLKNSFIFGNKSGGRVFEAELAYLDGSGTPELAIAHGNNSYVSLSLEYQYGLSIFNSTNLNAPPIYYCGNITSIAQNKRANSVASIDVNKKGVKNAWIYIDSVDPSIIACNRTSRVIKSISGISNQYEIKSGDLDGDGFASEFIYWNSSQVSAQAFASNNGTTNIWNFNHPFLTANRSGYSGTGIENNLMIKDIDGDNKTEVVIACSASGWVFILEGTTGALKLAYELPNSEFFIEGFNYPYAAKNTLLDTSKNATDNATLMGFGSSGGYPANGWLYAYEIEPCKISLPSGTPLRTMNWNVTTSSWYYYNNTGLPAGDYNYTIYCDGNFSGYGTAMQNGSLTFESGETTISFTVFTLGGGGNFTNSVADPYGNVTEAYYFNATGFYSPLVKPCANADATTYCQNGMTQPMYRVINTGNTQFNFYMRLSSSLPAGIASCANSTANGGTVTNTVSSCDLSGEGNLNASAWLLLGVLDYSEQINITRYANFSGVGAIIYGRIDYMNSTA